MASASQRSASGVLKSTPFSSLTSPIIPRGALVATARRTARSISSTSATPSPASDTVALDAQSAPTTPRPSQYTPAAAPPCNYSINFDVSARTGRLRVVLDDDDPATRNDCYVSEVTPHGWYMTCTDRAKAVNIHFDPLKHPHRLMIDVSRRRTSLFAPGLTIFRAADPQVPKTVARTPFAMGWQGSQKASETVCH